MGHALSHLFSPIIDIADGNKQPAYLILLIVMYGLALLPNMYALQYLFKGPATGYVVVCFYNILTGKWPVLSKSLVKNG